MTFDGAGCTCYLGKVHTYYYMRPPGEPKEHTNRTLCHYFLSLPISLLVCQYDFLRGQQSVEEAADPLNTSDRTQ